MQASEDNLYFRANTREIWLNTPDIHLLFPEIFDIGMNFVLIPEPKLS